MHGVHGDGPSYEESLEMETLEPNIWPAAYMIRQRNVLAINSMIMEELLATKMERILMGQEDRLIAASAATSTLFSLERTVQPAQYWWGQILCTRPGRPQ